MKKRVLSLVLTVAMIATLIPVAAFAADDTTTFPDMPNDWSTEALQNAIDNGLLNGIDGKIAASENLTRAQMAAIVTRAFGTNGSASLASFGDVNSGDWYYDAMAASVKMGAFKGDGNKLNPNVAITRQEAFTVLARLFTLTGADQSVLNGYTDGAKVADWAKDSMASMVKAGYVSGSDNMLNPTSNITRAEFAKVMDNLLKDYLAAGATEGKVTGNAILNKAGTLENVTVSGDLIVGDGAAEGDVTLKNVTVNGRLVVRGGGVNTVKLEGTTKVGSVVINKATGDVRLNNTTSTAVNVVVVSASATLTGKYDVVTLNTADTMLTAADATIATVNMNNEDTGLQLTGKSTVTTVNVNEDAKGAAVNVAKDSTITTVNSKADGVKMAGEGKITKANVSGNNNAVNTVGTVVTTASGVTGTTSNGNDIKGGTTNTTTSGTPTTGGSTSGGGDFGWGDTTTTANAANATELANEIAKGTNKITVTADISETVTATRESSNSLTIEFGTFKVTNGLTITAPNVTNITLNGTADPAINALTIDAPKAHVVNNVKTGTAEIKAASKNSYVANNTHTSIKLSGGARVVLANEAKAATISVETPETVILAGTMAGTITVNTANADATITGTAAEVKVTEAAEGANLTVAKGATVASTEIKADNAVTTVSGTATNVTVANEAAGASVVIEKGAASENLTVAAAGATASVAGEVGTVSVEAAAVVTVESGAKAEAVEVKAEGATASVSGEATKVTVSEAAIVAIESGAKVPEVAVTKAGATVSIDTANKVAVNVAENVTSTTVEATKVADVAVTAKGESAVTVNTEKGATVDTGENEKITHNDDALKVTFDPNGGSVSPAFTMVKSGETISTLPTPTKEGYTFVKWINKDNQNAEVTTSTTVSAVMTATAEWNVTTYTITYNWNGGALAAGEENPTTYTVESDAIILKNPTKANYDFDGWYNAAGDKVTTIAKGSTGNITLTAKWTATKYTITYNLGGGTNNAANPSTYTYESNEIVLAAPTRAGYTFQGWYNEKGEKVTNIPKNSTGNVVLTAKWKSSSDITVQARPAGDPENFDYAAAYKKAGVTITNGTVGNKNTAILSVDYATATAEGAIHANLEHGTKAYVGLQFTKPEDAVKATLDVKVNEETVDSNNDIDLTKDGDYAYKGELIEYLSFAEKGADGKWQILPETTFAIKVTWKDADGATLATDTYTVERKVTNVKVNVATAEELMAAANLSFADKTITLTSNITIPATNVAVKVFSGTLDGANHTITLPESLTTSKQWAILADDTTGYTLIKNLTIMHQDGEVLPFVGYGGRISPSSYFGYENVNINTKDSKTTANMSSGDNNESAFVACVFADTVEFKNCNNYLNYAAGNNILYTSAFLGGYMGENGNAQTLNFTNCHNYGDLSVPYASLFVGNGSGMGEVTVTVDTASQNHGKIVGSLNAVPFAAISTKGLKDSATLNARDYNTDGGSIEILTTNGLAISRGAENVLTITAPTGVTVSKYNLSYSGYASVTNKAGEKLGTQLFNVVLDVSAAGATEYKDCTMIDKTTAEAKKIDLSGAKWVDAPVGKYTFVEGYLVCDFTNSGFEEGAIFTMNTSAPTISVTAIGSDGNLLGTATLSRSK